MFARRRTVHRVNAVGSYGFANFGDDLFERTVQEQKDLLWPGSTVRTFVPDFARPAYSQNNLVGKFLRLATAVFGLVWADTIAICGGSVLHDVTGIAKLRASGGRFRKLEALGVSIGPFRDSGARNRVSALLDRTDRIVVRDRSSGEQSNVQTARSNSWTLGGDLAALSSMATSRSELENLITVCPSAASEIPAAEFAAQVVHALEALHSQEGSHYEIRLLALSSNPNSDDRPLCMEIASILSTKGRKVSIENYSELGLEDTCRLLGSSKAVWSQRLHGAIVAYLSNRPFILIGHHEKCVAFGEDIGAQDLVVPSYGYWSDAAVSCMQGTLKPKLACDLYRNRARAAYRGDL